MDKTTLTNFLFKARGKTNAKLGGQVKPLIEGTEQAEYSEGNWLYRDIYFNGKNSFAGIDVAYYQNKPVWASSYYAKYTDITEDKLDEILGKSIEKYPNVNTWERIDKTDIDGYIYENIPDSENQSIKQVSGIERITKDGKEIYLLHYAGGILE